MATAFILLNTEIGEERQVLKVLRDIDGVEEAHGLWGVYDIIVNIKAPDMDGLKEVAKRISAIGRINSKLTMIVSEHSPLSFINKKKPPADTKQTSREPMVVLI